jgi:hypothetical protein
MRTTGANMAWLIKTIAGSKNPWPEEVKRERTNFVRE